MPTARARYRRRPVYNQITRGQVERDNPGEGGPAAASVMSRLLLVDGTSFLLLTDGASMLKLASST